MSAQTLSTYIRDVRIRTDDDPVGGVPPYHSDFALTIFINNARRKISIDLHCYLKQMYIIPQLYIDEYNLPSDYLESSIIIDVLNQIPHPPINQTNVETTKIWFDTLISYGNFCFINTTRKKINFLVPFVATIVEPSYTIQSTNVQNNTIVVNAVSSGTLSNIMNWEKVKSYLLVTNVSTGQSENMRCSKILANTPSNNLFTLYISGRDMNNKYKNNLQCNGTLAVSSTNVVIYGTGTKFNTDLSVNDLVTVGNDIRSIADVSSDTSCNVNSVFTLTSSGNTGYVNSMPVYVANDTIQFVSYLMNYYGIAKDLVYLNEYCGFDYNAQGLVPILAAYESWMRRSRPDMAAIELNEYNKRLNDMFIKLNKG